jgi:hypothetical protein
MWDAGESAQPEVFDAGPGLAGLDWTGLDYRAADRPCCAVLSKLELVKLGEGF